MVRGRNYNPRQNNNPLSKNGESDNQLDQETLKQPQVEENRSEVDLDEETPIEEVVQEVIEESNKTEVSVPIKKNEVIADKIIKEESKNIPHYKFKMNQQTRRSERVIDIPKKEESVTIDKSKLDLLKTLLAETLQSIFKLEVEIEIQEEVVKLEIFPDKNSLAQRKLDTLIENLNSYKSRKKAIERLISLNEK